MRTNSTRIRPLHGWLLVSVLAVMAGACTSTPAETSPSSAAPNTTVTAAPSATAPDTTTTTLDPALAKPLPVDPDVRVGTLDNGLQYYIRYNDSPGLRAELRLAVDAGSLHEDDDQSGVAHFLEHMMFNGTQRFPRNDLTTVLESFGPQFGPDINASTSFDETLYELSLPAEDELLDLGVEVLREWATEATITATDVAEERGVVLEEWRLRDQGLNGRVSQIFQEVLLSETLYEGRAPIGTAGSIEAMAPEALDRFYRDWYQPERMAVVAVGDFDIDEMEERVTAKFGRLPRSDASRQPPTGNASPSNAIRAASLADPEIALTSIEIIWPRPAAATQTVGDLLEDYALTAAMNMLATRLNDDALRGTVPLLSAVNSSSSFTRAFELSTLSAQARPHEAPDALEALVTELARVRTHGFSDQEYNRAIEELTALAELDHENQGSTQDEEFAATLVAHYLIGGPLLSADQRFEIATEILERMTKSEVEAAFIDFLDSTAPRVVVVGPDDAGNIPDSADIETLFETIPTLSVEPHEDVPEVEALMTPPGPGSYTDIVVDEDLGFATVTYENGATVFYWPTTIAEDLVTVEVVSFGGTSLVAVDDVPEAELIPEIVARSGIGPADAAMLRLFLADRIVEVTPWISETREGISATAATEDAEVMLQMIRLLMTEPRADRVAVDAVLAEYRAHDASRGDVPGSAIDDQIHDAYYSGDPRYFASPTADQISEFDAERAVEIFRERFANAGDFAFAVVGDFDPASMSDLVQRYIATLPGSSEREQFVDHQPLPPRQVQLRTVAASTDPQGEVGMWFTNEFDPDAKDRLTGRVMELIVNARLRDRIREQLSATYSPRAGVSLQRDPDPFAETNVRVTGDPEKLDEISTEILAGLADLANNGPTETEFTTAVQQLRVEMDLISNLQLADVLTTSFLYPDQPVSDLIDRYTLVEEVTAGDVQALARIAYAPTQRIEIRLVPVTG